MNKKRWGWIVLTGLNQSLSFSSSLSHTQRFHLSFLEDHSPTTTLGDQRLTSSNTAINSHWGISLQFLYLTICVYVDFMDMEWNLDINRYHYRYQQHLASSFKVLGLIFCYHICSGCFEQEQSMVCSFQFLYLGRHLIFNVALYVLNGFFVSFCVQKEIFVDYNVVIYLEVTIFAWGGL